MNHKTMSQLKALADENRMKVVEYLFYDPKKAKTVGEIKNRIKIEDTLLSHHLRILRMAGIVVDKKVGKFREYSLVDEIPKVGIRLNKAILHLFARPQWVTEERGGEKKLVKYLKPHCCKGK